MPTNIESVGMQIRRHARSNNDWKDRDKVDQAYTMLEEINVHLFKQELPPIVVGFSNDLKLKAGNYYYESDSIGVKYHFDIHPNLDRFGSVSPLNCLPSSKCLFIQDSLSFIHSLIASVS